MFAEVGLHSMFGENHWRILAGINHTSVCGSSNGRPGKNEKKIRFSRAKLVILSCLGYEKWDLIISPLLRIVYLLL
jgi:hypothetical protein